MIYNNIPGGFAGTLGGGVVTIPAVTLSQEDGQALLPDKLGLTGQVVSSFTADASGYEAWNGTSMATPHVSGVAALLRSVPSVAFIRVARTAMSGGMTTPSTWFDLAAVAAIAVVAVVVAARLMGRTGK